ncbi:PH domain-containing protein [Parasalinivibrio latis]|uniref:PH domain-containing protein n=1 Tax=Parasalinivibrio latis TaxID=2952610 RepID=UPI0030DEE44E
MKDSKHVIKFKERHLQSGETVLAWADGYIGEMMGKGKDTQHNGSLLVTESRVVFYRKGILGEVLETIPLKSITSIERQSTLGLRTLRLHASHDDLTFKTFADKEQEHALIDAIEAGRQADAKIPAINQPNASDDAFDKIKKLAELKEAGVLSESEFQEKKEKLLAEI